MAGGGDERGRRSPSRSRLARRGPVNGSNELAKARPCDLRRPGRPVTEAGGDPQPVRGTSKDLGALETTSDLPNVATALTVERPSPAACASNTKLFISMGDLKLDGTARRRLHCSGLLNR
ncbi:hypothetical protein AAFF_G00095510 [Aldrovandia affinis]|uniref:Uncharacterized protein n=1 Tax=Aldrovandia affinis TaxID=143900 RepID=A0AAD7WBL6_9TELE|nr:hypothetical protein AAFF_G00095510 [Aldrovandia affinis]